MVVVCPGARWWGLGLDERCREGVVGGLEVGDAFFEIAEVVDAGLAEGSDVNSCLKAGSDNGSTCSMASLCISWSVQAGIIAFSTPNSSFIFDLRLRSITL